MNYRFQEKNHLHQLEVDGEWKNLTGCTTILGVIAKPALIQWAANMATDYMRKWWEDGADLGKFIDVLAEARTAHCKKKKDAGTYGTQTHSEIENIIKFTIENSGDLGRWEVDPEDNQSIKNFLEWTKTNKVKFLESEKNIYSEKLWIGGIVDFICEIDGKIWIGDIKTSGSGIYPEHFWQCAGYDLMLKDMGLYPEIAGYLILNLKESGEVLEKRSVSNEENKEAFLSCLKIYRIQEKIKSQVI
jgi:hypothetical protein